MTIAEKCYRLFYKVKPEIKLTNDQWKVVNIGKGPAFDIQIGLVVTPNDKNGKIVNQANIHLPRYLIEGIHWLEIMINWISPGHME